MFATAPLTGNNKPRSKVKRDCGARILVCSSGNHCVHRHRITVPIVSLADRAKARERVGSEDWGRVFFFFLGGVSEWRRVPAPPKCVGRGHEARMEMRRSGL